MKILTFTLFIYSLINFNFAIYSFSFGVTIPSVSSWLPSIPSVPYLGSLSSYVPWSSSESKSRAVPELSTGPFLSVSLNRSATAIAIDFTPIQAKTREFYKKLSRSIVGDSYLSVPELVLKHGYPCEIHTMVTPDGYILTMHRIPYGNNGSSGKRPVIFLQHGILASSADWVISGPNKALGYILADLGYDVWMGNNRGNTYSKNHTHFGIRDEEFWNFTWHEIALYDTTTMIDFALNRTGQEKLFYIGHSQGTTVFYVMCSEKPEYNRKIEAMFSLAPVVYVNNVKSPILQFIARGYDHIDTVLKMIGVNQFLPRSRMLASAGNMLCRDESIVQILCTNSLFAFAGYSSKQMNTTLLPLIMKHTPAGSSTKQFLHYAQEIISGKFQKWDYGSLINIEKYGTVVPPKYNLDSITVPVYLFYSKSDWLSAEDDVARLYMELRNVKGIYLIPDETFNHMDYLFGVEARILIYDHITDLLKSRYMF